jgi:hypothetical protein
VEDFNGQLKLEGGAVFGPKAGHFLVMPITDAFDPPLGTVLHGRLQFSDKVRACGMRERRPRGSVERCPWDVPDAEPSCILVRS